MMSESGTRKEGGLTMEQLRPYDDQKDRPRTGWDSSAIQNYLDGGAKLYVDELNEVWTENKKEYVGKIHKPIQ